MGKGKVVTRRWARVVLVASLLLAICAQWILCCKPGLEWVGAACYAVAVVLFVSSVGNPTRYRRRLSFARAPDLASSWRSGTSARHKDDFNWAAVLLATVVALVIVVLAAFIAHTMPFSRYNFVCAILVWLIGVTFGIVAWSGLSVRRRALCSRWRTEALIVGLFFALALTLRLVGVARFPDLMSGDEGSMALEARRIMRGVLLNPFGIGWFTHPTWFFYLQAAALRILGWNLFGLRFTSALLGALGVVAVYLLARETFGREEAWISALFLAGWCYPLHFSRLALNNSADPLFGASVLAFLQRGLLRGRRGDFVAAGLAMGVSLYFYFGTRLLVPLVLLVLVCSGAKRLRRRWRGVLAFVIVALLVTAPLLAYFIRRPHMLEARTAEIALFQTDELAIEQHSSAKSLPSLLIARLGRAAFAFIYTRDTGYFYNPDIPMLYIFSGALFVLGVGLALVHWREARYQVLLAWIGLTVLLGGWLLDSPPHYHRYIIVVPPVCLLVGRAGALGLRRAAQLWGWRPALRRRLVVLLAMLLLTLNAGYYFGVYVPAGAFRFDHPTEAANRAARLMAELGPDYSTYFFGTSYMGTNYAAVLAPDADWMNVDEFPPADWRFVQRSRGAVFIIPPEYIDRISLLRARFPGGEEWQVTGRDRRTLFIVYRVSPMDIQRPEAGGAL